MRQTRTPLPRPFLFLCAWVLAAGLMAGQEAAGDAAFRQADFKKAVKAYEKAIKAAPGNAELHYKLGLAYFKRSDLEKALSSFIRATNLDPRHERSFQALGDYFFVKGELEKAVKAYESLAAIRPDSAPYHFQLGKAYDKLMQSEPALDQFYRTVEINPAIEEAYPFLFKLLRMKILQNPALPGPHLTLARVYAFHRELANARAEYLTALQIEPENRAAWEELREVCRILQDCRCETGAVEGMRQFSPEDPSLLEDILQIARRCGMKELVIQYLELRIASGPARGADFAELGRLWQESENRVMAYFNFRRFLELCAGCPEAPEIRRWCDNEELDEPARRAQYDSFRKFQAGLEAYRQGQFGRALEALEQARAIYSAYPQVHFYTARCLEETGRRRDALFVYKEAIRLQPTHAGYWFTLGTALDAEKMKEQAAVCFQKAVDLDPENTSGYLLRAQKLLQSYVEQGIIKPGAILNQVQ